MVGQALKGIPETLNPTITRYVMDVGGLTKSNPHFPFAIPVALYLSCGESYDVWDF